MKNSIRRISFAASLVAAQILLSLPAHATETYHIALSGTVQSLGHVQPGAEILVQVQPYAGKAILAKTTAREDGRFYLKVAFEGEAKQHVSWTLTAQAGTMTSKVSEGRQILFRDSHLNVQLPVNLTEDAFTLAML